jgi:hypothetical protein
MLKRSSSVHPILICPFLAVRCHGEYEWQDPKSDDEVVNIVFIKKDGQRIPIRGKIGDNLLYLGHRYAVDIEGDSIKKELIQFVIQNFRCL